MEHYRKVHLGTPTYVSFVNYFKFLEPPPRPTSNAGAWVCYRYSTRVEHDFPMRESTCFILLFLSEKTFQYLYQLYSVYTTKYLFVKFINPSAVN